MASHYTKKLEKEKLIENKLKRATARKSKSAESTLLDGIINYYSGPRAFCKLLSEKLEQDIAEQSAVNWRQRGRIPLKLANPVSKILKVSVYALNYRDAKAFFDSEINWTEVVNSVKFIPDSFRLKVLALGEPK